MGCAKRITIRLNDNRWEALLDFSQATGHDVSLVVRKALDLFCPAKTEPNPSAPSPRSLAPPDQVLRLMTKYRAWARGDLRDERAAQYNELLAVALACKELFPKTNGVTEFYAGLLSLRQFIEKHRGV